MTNGLDGLVQAVIKGKNKDAVTYSENLLASGADVYDIVEKGLSPALKALDVKCTSEEFNLLEIMLAGRAMMDVMDKVVANHLGNAKLEEKGTIILGTIKGDIHELGKHVVRIIFRCAGYRVIDLGKDVEPEQFAQKAKEEKAEYIFVSSLISVVVPHVKEVKACLQRCNLRIPVVAGGATLQQLSAEELNVDYVAKNVFDGLHYVQRNEVKA